MGKKYELSIVFCGNMFSQRLNRAYRGKNTPTNVLSFPLSENSGEIFINLSFLKGFSVRQLFIHGCLHLEGMTHGAKMEKLEHQIFNGSSNRSGD